MFNPVTDQQQPLNKESSGTSLISVTTALLQELQVPKQLVPPVLGRSHCTQQSDAIFTKLLRQILMYFSASINEMIRNDLLMAGVQDFTNIT